MRSSGRGAGWELTPAFDVTHAYRPDSPWTSRHLMAVNGNFDAIASTISVGGAPTSRVPTVVREVRSAVDEWAGFAASAEIDDDTVKMVEADIERFRPG